MDPVISSSQFKSEPEEPPLVSFPDNSPNLTIGMPFQTFPVQSEACLYTVCRHRSLSVSGTVTSNVVTLPGIGSVQQHDYRY